MRRGAAGFGLSAKLLLLLLAFGAIPLGLAMAIGYTVSRAVIIEQSESALRELTQRQAVHLTTEMTRQRLLLRTITTQLPKLPLLQQQPTLVLSQLLAQSLPEDGVFDGLRVVCADGLVLAKVALGNSEPDWPARRPAADWSNRSAVVHRQGDHVLAYLIAVPATGGDQGVWLEGHVQAKDFRRLFALPEHMAGSIEPAIFESTGQPIVVGHEHAIEDLIAAFDLRQGGALAVARADIGGRPSLVATAPVGGTDWYFIAALPLEIALAPLARLRDSALISAAVLILLIVASGVLAARSVTTPLRDLAGAARQFGKAGVYETIRPRGRDEVGLLVESFNRMADDLERSRQEIERLHEREMERAAQLATVGELASGVAHEIRNPVTGVRGALELVLRNLPGDDASRPLLEEAERQLERIEQTTTQLLRYARPPELREVVVDADRLVDQAVHVVEAQARNAGIELNIEGSPGPVPVRIDPELMVQVLVNLMLNGIEAMPPEGRLTVRATADDSGVSIAVEDTGPGIQPEKRVDIFRPFFTTKHQGTGLGLSISHQIVTRHGGLLHVKDTPGGGATFVVVLPLADEDEDSGQQQA